MFSDSKEIIASIITICGTITSNVFTYKAATSKDYTEKTSLNTAARTAFREELRQSIAALRESNEKLQETLEQLSIEQKDLILENHDLKNKLNSLIELLNNNGIPHETLLCHENDIN